MTSPNIAGITSICIPSDTLLFSDHSPIHLAIESNRQTNSRSFSASHGNRFRFQVKRANWSHFKYNLNLIPIKNILTTDTFIDDKILLFQNKLLEIAKTSMPFTASTNKRVKSSIWWNRECEESKKEYKKQSRIYSAATTLPNLIQMKKSYAKFKKSVSAAKNKSIRDFMEHLDFKTPANKVYSFVRHMMNKPSPKSNNPPMIYNNIPLLTEAQRAEASLEFLSQTMGKMDHDKTGIICQNSKINRLSRRELHEPYNKPFTLAEIQHVISYLPKTAPGSDMIFPQFISNLNDEWISCLLDLINQAWDIGYFPKIWKTATSIMIPKASKDSSKIENHHFITLLPVFGKVYERLIKRRLNWEIEKRKFLKDVQCGFRKNRSTIDNLVCFQRDATYAIQNQLIMIAVFLDVESAFDYLTHRQILNGIIESGIRGRLLKFVKSYLEDREIHIRVGNTISTSTLKVKRGVPQGSALGPDLYNIGVYDIPLDDGTFRASIFADDKVFWVTGRTISEVTKSIKAVLQQLENWAASIDINFSLHKTKGMLITRKTAINAPTLTLGGRKIDYVNQMKFLAVLLIEI